MNSETRNCQNCKQSFTIEPDDFTFYEKIKVPPPTWCPECRFQRRLMFMNDRELYKRTCDLCKKSIIAMYPAESKLKVYCNSCWWSDKWDASEYAQDYDPARPFFEQLKELNESTPQMALELNYPTIVNSDYINHAATSKDSYLIFVADECQNVLYSEYLLNVKDSMDLTIFEGGEMSYAVINGGHSYQLKFSEDSDNCRNVIFSKDCLGCSDCFGCIGLRNKQYHIFNKPYSRTAYEEEMKKFKLDSYENVNRIRDEVFKFWLTFPHKFAHALWNANVTGEYVYGLKNAKNMYMAGTGTEDSRFCQLLTMTGTKNAYDYTLWGNDAQMIYETMIAGEGAYNIRFSCGVWPNVRDIEYSFVTLSSSNMFGCANIRNKQYCILNKQYSKEDYEKLRTQIIEDMNKNPYKDSVGRVYPYGEFFPPELSLFGYNETYAATFFPSTKEEAIAKGFSWYDSKTNAYEITLKPDQIPDRIGDVKDSIVNEIIACKECKKAFRIIPAELDLLRRFGVPAPRTCPNCRYKARWKRINSQKLYKRTCQCGGKSSENEVYKNAVSHPHHNENACSNEFETPYAPDRREIIYCENCYNAEVV